MSLILIWIVDKAHNMSLKAEMLLTRAPITTWQFWQHDLLLTKSISCN